MKAIISDIVSYTTHRCIDIITISEVTHFSYDSHTFHYELMKQLVPRFNLLSSEILGPIDALLMNEWLAGTIPYTIDELYKYVLQTGGIGTYRWLKYIKRHHINVQIIGGEIDQGWPHKLYFGQALAYILSPDFFNALNIKQYGSFTYRDNPIDFASISNHIKTIADKYIYDALLQIYTHEYSRLDCWYANLRKQIGSSKLFINGYHLGKNELGNRLSAHYNVLTLGMACLNKEVFYLPISRYFLKKHKITMNEYKNMNINDDPNILDRFWAAFDKLHVARYNTWCRPDRVIRFRQVFQPTTLELDNPKYKILCTVNNGRSIGKIDHNGFNPIPLLDDVHLCNNGWVDVAEYYDYIIFIPISRPVCDMYM